MSERMEKLGACIMADAIHHALALRDEAHIEIGDQEMFGFVARALDYGNLAFEDDRPDTLAEALAVLERGLREWFEDQGIDLEE